MWYPICMQSGGILLQGRQIACSLEAFSSGILQGREIHIAVRFCICDVVVDAIEFTCRYSASTSGSLAPRAAHLGPLACTMHSCWSRSFRVTSIQFSTEHATFFSCFLFIKQHAVSLHANFFSGFLLIVFSPDRERCTC